MEVKIEFASLLRHPQRLRQLLTSDECRVSTVFNDALHDVSLISVCLYPTVDRRQSFPLQ